MKSDRKDRVKEQKLVERDVVVINPLPSNLKSESVVKEVIIDGKNNPKVNNREEKVIKSPAKK